MKLVGELTQQQLKSVIKYIPVCGLFLWTENYPGKRRGTVVCSPTTGKYTYISIYGKRYPAHRLAWLYIYGEWPPDQIDHIDGDPCASKRMKPEAQLMPAGGASKYPGSAQSAAHSFRTELTRVLVSLTFEGSPAGVSNPAPS